MAVPDTDDTNSSSNSSSNSSGNSSAPQAARPSWEAPPRPAASRPALQPAPPRPAAPSFAVPAPEAPPASPYYAASKAAPSAYSPAPSTYAPAVSEAPAYDPDARYDLAGNPIPSSGSSAASPTLAAPFGYSAGNSATPGVWPPAAGGQPQYGGPQYGAQAYRNNSGEQSHLPPELEKLHWHWGAFFFPILWTKKHGLTTVAAMLTGGLIFLRVLRYIAAAISPTAFLFICMAYGLAYFGLQVFCGFNGHKIGWRNRHFPGGVEEYFKVQSAWMWWGFGVNVLLGPFIAFGIFVTVIAATLGTTHHAYRPYGSSYGTGGYSRPSTYDNSGTTSGGSSSNGDGTSSSSDSSSSSGQ